ncbi:MAG: GHKL domain-containing protein, partial [Candidatus Marinimicrobia bacterium]|nr:GHKL domain-containing protein [Candidatus Neomarinimicrobiota bacterium]
WLPYIEIAVVALFIFIGFTGYQTIRKSEQRLLWIGMARETAHQLGTPISSLLGWTALLNEKELSDDFQEIVSSMQQDIHRLEQVASRFSEISGREHFVEANLQDIIDNVVQYMQRRLPQTGKNISIELTGSADMQLPLNPDLLEWALENIIKNGVDAIERKSGTIYIRIHEPDSTKLYIDIEDTGKGLESQKDWDRIFKPGYTTKKRGWGLGLSLVRRIIEEYHNGNVTVIQSEAGQGTTIRITLFFDKLNTA